MVKNIKPKLKIDWCSYKAAKYACEHWHYSGTIPKSKLVKMGVWEDGLFIGSIIFGCGATRSLVSPYGLKPWEGAELVRVALREHKAPVSKMIAISLRMLKKTNPGLKLIISYADTTEGHHGGIYQAGNWLYLGKTLGTWFYKDKRGKVWHPRNVSEDLWRSGKMVRQSECLRVWKQGKHRYAYPLTETIRKQISDLSKPYPKRHEHESNALSYHDEEGGAVPTVALHLSGEK